MVLFETQLFYIRFSTFFLGYGVIVPKTVGGKIATIFFALLGIPFCLYTLAAAGNVMNYLINLLLQSIELRCLKRQAIENKNAKVMATQFILMIFAILIASGATSNSMGWSYFDSVYGWFITFSTIGFGDFVPYTGIGKLTDPVQYIASMLFSMFGLSIIASVINTIAEILQTRDEKQRDNGCAHLPNINCCNVCSNEEETSRDVGVDSELKDQPI